jgi:hypothetical protein
VVSLYYAHSAALRLIGRRKTMSGYLGLEWNGIRPREFAAGASVVYENHRTATTTLLPFLIVFAAISRSAEEEGTSLPSSLPVIHTCERKYVFS